MHSLTALEAKIKCQRSVLSLEALGKIPSLPLPGFWGLLATLGVSWLVEASLQSLPPSSRGLFPVCLGLCAQYPSTFKDTNPIGLRGHLNPA